MNRSHLGSFSTLPVISENQLRRSFSYETLGPVEISEEYDYGPLLRFNLHVLDIMWRYGTISPTTGDQVTISNVKYLLSMVGSGRVFARDYLMRVVLPRFRSVDPFLRTVEEWKEDACALVRVGIRSPNFVRNTHVPFNELDKVRVNTDILHAILKCNPNIDRADVYMELHNMWGRIDSNKRIRNKFNLAKPKLQSNSIPLVRIDWKLWWLVITNIILIFAVIISVLL